MPTPPSPASRKTRSATAPSSPHSGCPTLDAQRGPRRAFCARWGGKRQGGGIADPVARIRVPHPRRVAGPPASVLCSLGWQAAGWWYRALRRAIRNGVDPLTNTPHLTNILTTDPQGFQPWLGLYSQVICHQDFAANTSRFKTLPYKSQTNPFAMKTLRKIAGGGVQALS